MGVGLRVRTVGELEEVGVVVVVVVVLHILGVVLEMVEWAVVLRWWVVLGLVEYAVVLRVGATAEGVSLRGKPLPPLRFR